MIVKKIATVVNNEIHTITYLKDVIHSNEIQFSIKIESSPGSILKKQEFILHYYPKSNKINLPHYFNEQRDKLNAEASRIVLKHENLPL